MLSVFFCSVNRTHSRRGVTLVELIVAVVVVGAIFSLLMPAVMKMRLSSQNAKCVSQLRQIGPAALSYAGDRRGVFESVMGGKVANDFWPNMLFKLNYLPDKATFRCPSAKATIDITNVAWMWHAYGLNMVEGPYSTVTSPKHRLKVRVVENPASYPFIMDSIGSAGGSQTFRIGIGKEGAGRHHFGKANVLFLDGHVRSLDAEELKDLGFASFQ